MLCYRYPIYGWVHVILTAAVIYTALSRLLTANWTATSSFLDYGNYCVKSTGKILAPAWFHHFRAVIMWCMYMRMCAPRMWKDVPFSRIVNYEKLQCKETAGTYNCVCVQGLIRYENESMPRKAMPCSGRISRNKMLTQCRWTETWMYCRLDEHAQLHWNRLWDAAYRLKSANNASGDLP